MVLLKPIFTYEISLCHSLKQSIHSESVPDFSLKMSFALIDFSQRPSFLRSKKQGVTILLFL